MPIKKKLTLEIVKERIQHLPLLPSLVCDLMSLDTDSSDFFSIVAELAKKDPPLTAKVLKIVNSASSSPTQDISNLEQALIRVGVAKILSFITSVSVSRVFTPSTDQQKGLWQHSLETAKLAEFIAENTPSFNVDKDLAYTCGLLHDIGRFVLFEISAKAIDVIDSAGWDSPIELPDTETKILGFTHAEVGHLAAKKWRLPKIVTEVIRHHHRYDLWEYPDVPEDFKQLETIIQFADFISVWITKNPTWPDLSKAELRKEIKAACIHDAWPDISFPIDKIVEELPLLSVECNQVMNELRIG